MLQAMGLETGIDLENLLRVREIFAAALPHEDLYGFKSGADVPFDFARRNSA